jgi:hypothetical protein
MSEAAYLIVTNAFSFIKLLALCVPGEVKQYILEEDTFETESTTPTDRMTLRMIVKKKFTALCEQ